MENSHFNCFQQKKIDRKVKIVMLAGPVIRLITISITNMEMSKGAISNLKTKNICNRDNHF